MPDNAFAFFLKLKKSRALTRLIYD